jgi:chromate transporter
MEHQTAASGEARPASFSEALRVWTRVAMLSFGGPAGQIATMHRIVVDEKKWIDEPRFLHALNFCMLLPGPEAQQLATYVGWLLHGPRGGLAAGLLFILPGVFAIMALSMLYAAFGQTPLVGALFFGLKAAVLAVVLEALLRIARRALKNGRAYAIAAASFVLIFFFDAPFPALVLGAGVVGYLGARGPDAAPATSPDVAAPRADLAATRRWAWVFLALWLAPVAALPLWLGPDHVFPVIAVFFSKMAVVTFGGAYAVLAYVAQQAVETHHWLKPGEMLDGLGMAETTPGPLIMVLQFVGFLAGYRAPGALPPMLSGALAGLLATWVTFAPCFLWIFAGAPYVERLRESRALAGALAAVTAAVVGVILNLAVWFAIHVVFRETWPVRAAGLAFDAPVWSSLDPWALALALGAALAMFRFHAGMAATLAGAGAAGLALHGAGLA